MILDRLRNDLDEWNALRPGWLARVARAESFQLGHVEVVLAVQGPDGHEREILPLILDPETNRPSTGEIQAIVEDVAQRMRGAGR